MNEAGKGALAAAGAYVLWGLTPLYFKAIQSVPALEIVAHRVLWSALLLLAVLALARRLDQVRIALKTPALGATLALTAVLVTSNWLIFVWAVNHGRILDASLGYYINPLISIALGAIFLGERLRRVQMLAVALALAGVVNELRILGHLPWISLSLALTFGFYGLLRKRTPVDAASGLLIETGWLVPIALGWLGWLAASGELAFAGSKAGGQGTDGMQALLLMSAGIVTTLPLLLFAFGARRLTLATLGFVQYLAPTINLILAVVVYNEPLPAARLTSFALIWSALLLYSAELWLHTRRKPAHD